MRAVAPDRRPPVAAWGFAALALLPLGASWAALRYGWAGPARELGLFWALALAGFFAGMIGAAGSLRGRWGPAYLALIAVMAPLLPAWLGGVTLTGAVSAALLLTLGLDLWGARAGLVPDWWPRLKLGFTVVALALLLTPLMG